MAGGPITETEGGGYNAGESATEKSDLEQF